MKLPAHVLEQLVQSWRIGDLSAEELLDLFRNEPSVRSFLPDGYFVTDPRSGIRILFNPARSRRPHDNHSHVQESRPEESNCIICQGQTTGIVDAAQLSQGYTFINKNRFPALFPLTSEDLSRQKSFGASSEYKSGGTALGLHFLQWTSSLHDRDWHNMPAADRLIVMERLAALEEKLLVESPQLLKGAETSTGEGPEAGWVLISKNFGRLVGGSLVHGHQQIVLSSVMPKRYSDHRQFEQKRGETFGAFLLRENPFELMVKDYGPAVLLVPYFMRRPYDMMLLFKRTGLRYLHELDRVELQAAADGWRDAICIMREVMPAIGRETAFIVLTNNGPGSGLYFEFRPYTQELGGFEQLGLLVCQADPADTAGHVKRIMAAL